MQGQKKSELSDREIWAILSKEHPTTAKERQKKIVTTVIIGLIVGVAFRIAWDYGIIAVLSSNIWHYSRPIIAGWKDLLNEAFG